MKCRLCPTPRGRDVVNVIVIESGTTFELIGYVPACEDCTPDVIRYQHRQLGHTVDPQPVDGFTFTPVCRAYWRSHACGLPEGHGLTELGELDGHYCCGESGDPDSYGCFPLERDEIRWSPDDDSKGYVITRDGTESSATQGWSTDRDVDA